MPQQPPPAALQGVHVRRDGPGALQLDAGVLPGHQVRQPRPAVVVALRGGTERRLPAVRAVLPAHRGEAVDGVQRVQLPLAGALDAGVTHLGRLVRRRAVPPDGHRDGHRRADGEDVVVVAARDVAFAAEVDDPDLVAHPPQVAAHAEEGVAVQIA